MKFKRLVRLSLVGIILSSILAVISPREAEGHYGCYTSGAYFAYERKNWSYGWVGTISYGGQAYKVYDHDEWTDIYCYYWWAPWYTFKDHTHVTHGDGLPFTWLPWWPHANHAHHVFCPSPCPMSTQRPILDKEKD